MDYMALWARKCRLEDEADLARIKEREAYRADKEKAIASTLTLAQIEERENFRKWAANVMAEFEKSEKLREQATRIVDPNSA